MRTAPAVQVSVTRFGVWRTAVGSVAVGVVSVLLTWVLSHWRAEAWPAVLPVVAVGATAACASVWFALRLVTQARPFDLRWDGLCWHLAAAGATADEPVAGEVSASVDAGGWLLLRFVPERSSRQAASRWLALQRRGLEPQWHALRCAVFSPRPVV